MKVFQRKQIYITADNIDTFSLDGTVDEFVVIRVPANTEVFEWE